MTTIFKVLQLLENRSLYQAFMMITQKIFSKI